MKIITTERPTSWTQRIEELDTGAEMHADYKNQSSVRDAISKVQIKTGRKYTTEKIGKIILKVLRVS